MPYDSRDVFFSLVGSTGSTHDLSAHLTSIDGLPGERELVDVTRLGDTGHRFIASLWNGRLTFQGLFDKTASTGADVVLTSALGNTSAQAFVYGPTGASSGASPVNRRVTGSLWIRSYVIAGSVGAAVAFSADGQVEGNVAFGTFT
jgi:hypothetical protein